MPTGIVGVIPVLLAVPTLTLMLWTAGERVATASQRKPGNMGKQIVFIEKTCLTFTNLSCSLTYSFNNIITEW